MKITVWKIYLIIMTIVLIPISASAAERIVLTIDDITISVEDTIAVLPVFLDSPHDSLAGVEVYFKIEENNLLHFASDDVRPDGLSTAADTAGTIISGWEWIGISTLENTLYDLKVSALADWPDQKRRPPITPQSGGLLVKLLFRYDKANRLPGDTVLTVTAVPEKSGFSDPFGNTIGVVTSMKKVCTEFAGDSCLVWKNKRVGILDTAQVKFNNGSIRVSDTLEIK